MEAIKQYHREWDEDNLIFKDAPHHDWASDYCDALRYLAIVVTPDMPEVAHSADNALQSARLAAARASRPHVGYNLETLHADNLARQPRAMP